MSRWFVVPESIGRAGLIILFLTSSVSAAVPSHSLTRVQSEARNQLLSHLQSGKTSFEPLLRQWAAGKNESLISALETLARDRKLEDRGRYIAILAVARLGNDLSRKRILSLVNDPNWMVRSAVLKVIQLTRSPEGTRAVETLLKDRALVIRTQAVDTLIDLRPPHLSELLVSAIFDSRNYRNGDHRTGRAQWVPQHALAGLRKIRATGASRKLLPLLTESRDPKLRAHALFTIESLEKRRLRPTEPFEKRVEAWRAHFESRPRG